MARTFETVISVLDKFSGPIVGLEDKLARLGHVGQATQRKLNMSPSAKLWNELTAHVNEAKATFGELGAGIGEVGGRLGEVLPMFAALGGAASVAGLVEMAHATAEAAEALENVSKITGIAVPQLQVLDYEAKQTGVGTDVLAKGFEMLSVRIGRAAIGLDKQTALMFHKLKINLRDSTGHVRSAADVMPQLEKAFDDTKDPALRAALAMQLFGRSGVELLPFLTQGPEKIAELQAQFNKFGYKFSGGDQAGLEQFNSAWKNVGLSVQGLKDDISAKLAPVLAPLLNDFAKFVASNRDIIALDLKDVITKIGDELKKVDFKTISTDVSDFGGNIKTVVDYVGGFTTALEIVGGAMLLSFAAPAIQLGISITALGAKMAWMAVGPILELGAGFIELVPAMASVSEVFEGLGIAMSANPLGVAVIGAVALGTAGYELYQHWDTVSKDLSAAFNFIGTEFDKVFGPIEKKIDQLGTAWDKLTGLTGDGDNNVSASGSRAVRGASLHPDALKSALGAAPQMTTIINNAPPGTTVTSSSQNAPDPIVKQNTGPNGTIRNHRG